MDMALLRAALEHDKAVKSEVDGDAASAASTTKKTALGGKAKLIAGSPTSSPHLGAEVQCTRPSPVTPR